jgi:hypothetical protein
LNSKLDVRDLALDDLEHDRIQAFASDEPMLRTLFDKGVEGESESVKHRNPYKESSDYVIFPAEQGKYLPYLSKQFYAIAINKDTNYHTWLRDTIDHVLTSDSLKSAGGKIEQHGSDVNIGSGKQGPKGKDEPGPGPDPTIIVAVIAALATLGAAYVSRKK